jgi:hypothetical protein
MAIVTCTYVLIMLCHNFLIGKGHTCALRTTYMCSTMVRTRVLIMLCHNMCTTVSQKQLYVRSKYVRTHVNTMYVHVYVPLVQVVCETTLYFYTCTVPAAPSLASTYVLYVYVRTAACTYVLYTCTGICIL